MGLDVLVASKSSRPAGRAAAAADTANTASLFPGCSFHWYGDTMCPPFFLKAISQGPKRPN